MDNDIPHPHTKARSSKTIRMIFLKLSDIVPNNITVTNLHYKNLKFLMFFYAFDALKNFVNCCWNNS